MLGVAFAAMLSACHDSIPTPPSAETVRGAGQRLVGATNVEIPRFPEPVDVVPAQQVSDPDSFRDLTDAKLVESVRNAGGKVSIGLKPATALRTSTSRVLPAMTRAEVLAARAALEASGVRIVRSFRHFAAVAAEINPETAPSLRLLPVVNYVEAELSGHPLAQSPNSSPGVRQAPAASNFGAELPGAALSQGQDTTWGAKKIRAHQAWSIEQRGQQSFITIIDAGLDLTHISSGDGPAGFYGDCLYAVTDTCYWTAAVTGVLEAGVIAGRDDEQGYIGIANQPVFGNFASVKVIDDEGNVDPANVAAALDWAIGTNYPRHIVNIGVGFCEANSVLATAVQATANAGILMVAGVGPNNVSCPFPLGTNGVMYPARYDEVIGVSGTTEDDTFWSGDRVPCGSTGSRSGVHVEVSAPFWAWSMAGFGEYYFDCGTLYSAAAVTGVAALAWTKYPSFSAAQLRTHLDTTARDLGASGYDGQFGWGRIDAAKAVDWQPPPPPPPPFSVTVFGPTEVQASLSCTWSAGVTGGTAPFSYSWTVNGQSAGTDSPNIMVSNDGNPFTLVVTVTDAVGSVRTDDHSVSINAEAFCQ